MKGSCDICGTDIEVTLCCSGHECGCMGLPVEPPVCSEECYDKLMNKFKQYPDIDFDAWLNKYGPEGLYDIANKFIKIADEDVNNAIQQANEFNTVMGFYNEITSWLLPKGYEEIYQNHSSCEEKEFHFIKDGVRVVCVSGTSKYCYLCIDILKLSHNLTLKTNKFIIGSIELDPLHSQLLKYSTLIK